MVRAYGLRVILFGLIGLLVGWILAAITTPKYEAVMQILVDQRQSLGGRAQTEAEDSVSDLLESTGPRSVATQVEQLTGFQVLREASIAVAQARGTTPQAIPELANLQDLAKTVVIEAAGGSDVITMRIRMSNQQLAEDMAREIYNAFYAQNVNQARDVGQRAIATLEEKVKSQKAKLTAIDADIEKFRRENDLPSVEAKVVRDVDEVGAYGNLLESAKIEHVGAVAQLTSLERELASTPKEVRAATNTSANPTYQSIEAGLVEARAQLAQARVNWQEDSQIVQSILGRTRRLEQQLQAARKQIPAGNSSTPNPVYQQLVQQVAGARAAADSARVRLQQAQSAVDSRRTLLAKLPALQRGLEERQREQITQDRIYQTYVQRLDTLRLNGRGRLATPTIVTPATSFPSPVSPNYPLNLGAGLIAGVILGMLFAFNTESRKSPIRTLSHLNRLTLEPAFRTIPELPYVPMGSDKQPNDVFLSLLGNFTRSPKRPYRIGVIGVDPDSGATLTSASMALAASMEGHATLVVDSAKDRGAAHRLGANIVDHIGTINDRLSVLKTSGQQPVDFHATAGMVQNLEGDRQLVIFDLQPFRGGSNPVMFIAGLDECIILVRAGRTRTVDFLQAQQMLIDAGIPQVTVVLARARNIDDDFSLAPSDPSTRALVSSR